MRFHSLSIEGFRVFGPSQDVALDSPLVLVYGDNSKGKTSLAEAIEFLLCGSTSRRDVVATTKTEFAKGLTNTHFRGAPSVTADLTIGSGGAERRLVFRRVLDQDYPNQNGPCQSSAFEVAQDGNCSAFDLGVASGQEFDEPIKLPIIFQHTLRYVSSAKPSERKSYFRKLLDVEDITSLRESVKEASARLLGQTVPHPSTVDLAELCADYRFATLGALTGRWPLSMQDVEVELRRAMTSALHRLGIKDSPEADPVSTVRRELPKLRSRVTQLPSLSLPLFRVAEHALDELEQEFMSRALTLADALDRLEPAKMNRDQSLELLQPLFRAFLEVPDFKDLKAPVDCPLCETPSALTRERVELIQATVAEPQEVRNASEAVHTAVLALNKLLGQLIDAVSSHIPPSLRDAPVETIEQYSLATPEHFKSWVSQFEAVLLANGTLVDRANRCVADMGELEAPTDGATPASLEKLSLTLQDLGRATSEYAALLMEYAGAETPLTATIRAKVDEATGLHKLEDLRSLWDERNSLLGALSEQAGRKAAEARLHTIVDQITRANADVLKSDKFPSLSRDVEKWWTMLRPGEPVSFSGVVPAGQGLAAIDIKCTILDDPADPRSQVERDAVAIFSDSQLNCLGLSLFLARAERENSGFIVFDDPIQSMDVDHQDFFVSNVVEALIDNLGFQVIILSHDWVFWESLRLRYSHLRPKGLKVEKQVGRPAQVNDLDTRLTELLRYIDKHGESLDPTAFENCANKVRIAIEVLFKEIIVLESSRAGMPRTLSSLGGEDMSKLRQMAAPYLAAQEASKVDTIVMRTNPGSHDDPKRTPAPNIMKTFAGQIREIAKAHGLLQ